jgi:hypothetical protein
MYDKKMMRKRKKGRKKEIYERKRKKYEYVQK